MSSRSVMAALRRSRSISTWESVQNLIHTSSQLLDQLCQGKGVDYAAVETSVAKQTAALERATHQALLSALDIDTPWIQVNGVVHARAGRYGSTYYTLPCAPTAWR
jgi:hypothetical protein